MKHILMASFVLALSMGAGTVQADNQKLRIISWADYVPADLIAAFKKEVLETAKSTGLTAKADDTKMDRTTVCSRCCP